MTKNGSSDITFNDNYNRNKRDSTSIDTIIILLLWTTMAPYTIDFGVLDLPYVEIFITIRIFSIFGTKLN